MSLPTAAVEAAHEARLKDAGFKPEPEKALVTGETLCAHCRQPRREHYGVNYSDGPQVSGEVLICPVSVFRPEFSGPAFSS